MPTSPNPTDDVNLPLTPSMRLDGRAAFVTGAGRGIGPAAAAALAEAGAHVTLVARTLPEILSIPASGRMWSLRSSGAG
jgi:hypothetical protein